MRTTLTIEDDLAGLLQQKARQQGRSYKSVVNDVLRAGLATGGEPAPRRKGLTVRTRRLGLKPGCDPHKLNQLADELKAEEFARKHRAK